MNRCRECELLRSEEECRDAQVMGFCPCIDYGECFSSAIAHEVEE